MGDRTFRRYGLPLPSLMMYIRPSPRGSSTWAKALPTGAVLGVLTRTGPGLILANDCRIMRHDWRISSILTR